MSVLSLSVTARPRALLSSEPDLVDQRLQFDSIAPNSVRSPKTVYSAPTDFRKNASASVLLSPAEHWIATWTRVKFWLSAAHDAPLPYVPDRNFRNSSVAKS
jgi:hypothetical protein